MDYSGTAGNSPINYSGVDISPTAYRFVTFCWKLPPRTTGPYSGLTFTFNSISALTSPAGSVKTFSINNTATTPKFCVFYAFQDASDPGYSGGGNAPVKYNTVWINANVSKATNSASLTNTSFNPTNTTNRYGFYNALQSSISPTTGSTTTLTEFMPGLNITNNSTYLYLRIGIPMSIANIEFGSVSARISG